MSDDIVFETFLFISPKKMIISVNNKIDFKTVYQKETLIDIEEGKLDYKKIDRFLNENIFIIEKILKKFVKKINLIIETKVFFSVLISVKNKNYDEVISQNTLDYLLNEAKSQCQETIYGKKIIHMVIDNYLIDNENCQSLTLGQKFNSFSLDLTIICLPEEMTQNFEQILSKYQISIDQIVDAKYIKNFFRYDKIDVFNMANKIINGFNENEVKIVNKRHEKKGIFERFFDLFS